MLQREDGYRVEVVRGIDSWWFGNTGRKLNTLAIAKYDLEHGYTAKDQLKANSASWTTHGLSRARYG